MWDNPTFQQRQQNRQQLSQQRMQNQVGAGNTFAQSPAQPSNMVQRPTRLLGPQSNSGAIGSFGNPFRTGFQPNQNPMAAFNRPTPPGNIYGDEDLGRFRPPVSMMGGMGGPTDEDLGRMQAPFQPMPLAQQNPYEAVMRQRQFRNARNQVGLNPFLQPY